MISCLLVGVSTHTPWAGGRGGGPPRTVGLAIMVVAIDLNCDRDGRNYFDLRPYWSQLILFATTVVAIVLNCDNDGRN